VQDATTVQAERDAQVRRLREEHPVFRIEDASADPSPDGVTLGFSFAAGALRFRPSVQLTGLKPEEVARVTAPTARRIVRALAIVEAFSYWKALCSPVIEVALPAPDAAELDWWRAFWPGAMGEFFYRNQIGYTAGDFLAIRGPVGAPERPDSADRVPGGADGANRADGADWADGADRAGGVPLVLFSGGKDSLALARITAAARGAAPVDFFLYNPGARLRGMAGSLAAGGRVLEAHRAILPELLRLNAAGHPNGHTPFSAYLAFAAMLTGYLRGSGLVVAGNSRSDDEPNVPSYLGRPVNHQWTKSFEFETATGAYRDRWLPGAPGYSSPLRPLYELQIIASLSGDVDGYLSTASCNRAPAGAWCRSCAKCAWVFLATAALFGHDLAIRKIGADMFADPALAGVYQEMAGLTGTKPFECTGTEDEVRTAIQAAGRGHDPAAYPALAACLRDPAVAAACPLAAMLAEWGHDERVPAVFLDQVSMARAEAAARLARPVDLRRGGRMRSRPNDP
jgi:UDP-N-acetyl-alpha-D-muramoyl-L-alanyl-L-glutamate epimerase